MQHATTRKSVISFLFTDQTYELLADYAKAGHIPPLDPDYFEGDASSIVLASDGLILLTGDPSWDRCDAALVLATIEFTGMHLVLASTVHAVHAFRRWLHETGRGSDDGIDTLERLASELGNDGIGGIGGVTTMIGMRGITGLTSAYRASRVERRAATARARRALRRQ